MLTKDMILLLLEELSFETVTEFDGYRVQKKSGFGYSDDKERGTTQAALSIMLEMALNREGANV